MQCDQSRSVLGREGGCMCLSECLTKLLATLFHIAGLLIVIPIRYDSDVLCVSVYVIFLVH